MWECLIPRRATDSRLTALGGDRVFPGAHRLARFGVHEDGQTLRITVATRDGGLGLSGHRPRGRRLGSQLFGSLEDAIDFFRQGTLGYSPGANALAGVRLKCSNGKPVRWSSTP